MSDLNPVSLLNCFLLNIKIFIFSIQIFKFLNVDMLRTFKYAPRYSAYNYVKIYGHS